MSDHLTPEQLAHFKLLASNSMGLGIGGWQSEIKNVDLAALLDHIDAQAATLQRVTDLHKCERRYQTEGAEDAGSFDTPEQVICEHENGTYGDGKIVVTYFEVCAECARLEANQPHLAELSGDEWGYEAAMWPCETKKALDGDR